MCSTRASARMLHIQCREQRKPCSSRHCYSWGKGSGATWVLWEHKAPEALALKRGTNLEEVQPRHEIRGGHQVRGERLVTLGGARFAVPSRFAIIREGDWGGESFPSATLNILRGRTPYRGYAGSHEPAYTEKSGWNQISQWYKLVTPLRVELLIYI